MNIIFVGFMGCGKTTIARIIAQKHGLRFVDTDKIIESIERRPIIDIFKLRGESYFRELEKNVINDYLAYCTNCSIAVGGGLPCFFDNMEKLKSIGWVIYLSVPFDVIVKRIENSKKRPLFRDIDKAKKLYEDRQDCYNKAHFVVELNEMDKEEAVKRIESLLKGKWK